MRDPAPGDAPSLIAQLKRRKVFRVAAVYAATAFVILQVADLLASGLSLPGWVFRAITLLIIVAFPVALVLAWAFEITPEGVQRTAPAAAGGGRGAERWLSGHTLAMVAGLLLAGVAAGWLIKPSPATGAPAALAVLPFTNLGAAEDEYFADGMSDALRGKLAGIEGLVVIGSASSRPYKGSTKSPGEIASELGVRYLLTGTVHWARSDEGPSRIQVRPELVLAESGATRWQQPFDAVLSDVFAVQGEIASRVADALSLTLLEPERRALARRPTNDLRAYDAYLRASALLQQAELGRADRRLAAEGFRRALELDPGFALAWAQLGYAHMGAFWFAEDRSESRLRQARAAADTALALAPDLPEAHLADAYYWYWGWRSYDRALAAFERARRLDPNSSAAMQGLGNVRRRQGRLREAAQAYRRALELDPRDAVTQRELGLTLIPLGELEEADRASARAIALAPSAIGGYLFRGQVQYAREEAQAAAATLAEAIRVIGLEDVAVELANRQWTRWLAFTDSTTWRVLEDLPLSSQVADTGSFYLLRAEWLRHRGARQRAVALADSAMPFLEARARDAGDDWWFLGQLALAHALAGRTEAAAEGMGRALATLERAPDAWDRSDAFHHAAKVAVAGGDAEAALSHLTDALAPGSHKAAGFVAADLRFAPLRGDARFQELVGLR